MDETLNQAPDAGQPLTWRADGVPVSCRFDDPFFSLDNGLAEAEHVFLAGNDLTERLCDGFRVAELGFGTGLNLLALARLWGDRPGTVRFTSFEAFPMEPADMARALAHFPDVAAEAAQLVAAWESGARSFRVGGVEAEVVSGDARVTVPAWTGQADAWFLDGFSPAKNPELWEPDLLSAVAAHTAPDGTAATYSAAGAVRRALEEAGFTVSRTPGFGRKRHMTRAAFTAC